MKDGYANAANTRPGRMEVTSAASRSTPHRQDEQVSAQENGGGSKGHLV